MLSAKTKGLFIERGHFSTLVAITSSPLPPFKIERIEEFSGGDDNPDFHEFISSLASGKAAARFVHGHVGVYPRSRFFRRHSIESGVKLKEASYFSDLLEQQFRIDSEKNMAVVLNATDGTLFDLAKGMTHQKELLICGATQEELAKIQDAVVESGIYPERLELGTLSMLGGLLSYSRHIKLKRPVLAVEIGPDRSNLFILTNDRVDLCRPIPHGLDSMFPIIQSELGLKDEESARKLLYSNTFDFTETAATLLRKLLKELQASIGFYEVQTGQSIGHMHVHLLPENLAWIRQALSRSLGVKALHIDFKSWLEPMGVSSTEEVQLDLLDQRWQGLLSMLPNYSPVPVSAPATPAAANGKAEE